MLCVTTHVQTEGETYVAFRPQQSWCQTITPCEYINQVCMLIPVVHILTVEEGPTLSNIHPVIKIIILSLEGNLCLYMYVIVLNICNFRWIEAQYFCCTCIYTHIYLHNTDTGQNCGYDSVSLQELQVPQAQVAMQQLHACCFHHYTLYDVIIPWLPW